jgi:hypothetical protein
MPNLRAEMAAKASTKFHCERRSGAKRVKKLADEQARGASSREEGVTSRQQVRIAGQRPEPMTAAAQIGQKPRPPAPIIAPIPQSITVAGNYSDTKDSPKASTKTIRAAAASCIFTNAATVSAFSVIVTCFWLCVSNPTCHDGKATRLSFRPPQSALECSPFGGVVER